LTAQSSSRTGGFPAGPRLRRLPGHALLLLLILALAYLVIVPLVRLQALAFADSAAGYRAAFTGDFVARTIRNTAGLAIGSLIIGMVFGTLLAWWSTHLSPRLSWLKVLPVLPIVIPAVANVSGWAFLLSPRPGYLNGVLRLLPWWSHLTEGPADAYSLFWIVAITGFSLSAFVYLFVTAGLRNIGAELIEASRVNGASATATFFRIVLPLLRPVLLYGGGVALLLGLGQFTAPLLLGTNKGVSVLTTDIYFALNEAPVDFGKAAAIGSPLLVLGLGIVLVQKLLLSNQARFVTHGGRAFRLAGKPSRLAAAGILLYAFVTVGLPLISLCILAFSNFWSPRLRWSNVTLDNFVTVFREAGIVDAVLTSVATSLIAVVISLAIGFVVAAVLVRGQRNAVLRATLDIIVAMPLGIPAVIFGAGFLFTYSRPPIVLYGTWWVLVVVYVTLMLPFTTRMQLSGMLQLGSAYREASRVCGANGTLTDLRITLPLMRATMGGAAALMFVLLTHEFTASVLVRSPRNQVMGTVLFDYWANGSFPVVAAIALIMTAVTAAGVFMAMLIGGRDVLSKLS
jgi:iron(III) transport system permease protein